MDYGRDKKGIYIKTETQKEKQELNQKEGTTTTQKHSQFNNIKNWKCRNCNTEIDVGEKAYIKLFIWPTKEAMTETLKTMICETCATKKAVTKSL